MVIPSTLWLAQIILRIFLIWYFLAFLVYLVKGRGVDPAMIRLTTCRFRKQRARFVGSLILTPAVKIHQSSLLHCDFCFYLSIYRCIYVGHSLGLALLVMTGFNVFAPMVPLGDPRGNMAKTISFRLWQNSGLGIYCIYYQSSLLGILIDAFGHPIILYGLIAALLHYSLPQCYVRKSCPKVRSKTEHHHVYETDFRQPSLAFFYYVFLYYKVLMLITVWHLYWEKAGYDTTTIGYLVIGVVAEVVVFMFSKSLFRRWSARNYYYFQHCRAIALGMMGSLQHYRHLLLYKFCIVAHLPSIQRQCVLLLHVKSMKLFVYKQFILLQQWEVSL